METIVRNVQRIREEIRRVALECGRNPEEILLCAASKMNDADRVRVAVEAGVDCCGENRVQELVQKQPLGAYGDKPVHFIGHLQTNKVNKVVGKVRLIQSVDRMELLVALEKCAQKMGVTQDILLEVNIGMEESKSGFTKEEALHVAGEMGNFPHLRLKGLMAIPPLAEVSGGNLGFFAEMRRLAVDIRSKKYDNVSMDCLSMGMSEDFADAIREGSTMIRVGTAIFGARNYGK